MFRGIVEELQLYGTYKYEDSNGKEREHTNWFTVPVNWSTNGKWVKLIINKYKIYIKMYNLGLEML